MSSFATALALVLAAVADLPASVDAGPADSPPAVVDAPAIPDDPAAIEPPPTQVHDPQGARAQPDGAAFDAPGEARLTSCLEAIAQGRELEARACLQGVADGGPGTLPAAKAAAALAVLDAQALARANDTDVESTASAALIPAGRLGITTAAGLFGVWNGVATGIITQITAPSLNPGITLIGTGVLAVGLGATFAVGGYLLADKLQLDEGSARLVASGLVWGTSIGAGTSFITADSLTALTHNGTVAIDGALITVLLGGYGGAGAALGIASMLTFDEAQVSLVNTGGWVGSLLGLLILPNYLLFLPNTGAFTGALYGATYAVMNAAGLAAGGVAGRFVNLTWGEALLADLGAVAGVVLGGAVSLGIVAGTNGQLGDANVPFVTGAVAAGALGGAGVAVGGAMWWRAARGAPLLRGDAEGLRATVGTVGAVVDMKGRVVATAPIIALAW